LAGYSKSLTPLQALREISNGVDQGPDNLDSESLQSQDTG